MLLLTYVGQQHYNATSTDKLCDEFLPGQKRKVVKMRPDENCSYSAVSFQFGTQNEMKKKMVLLEMW